MHTERETKKVCAYVVCVYICVCPHAFELYLYSKLGEIEREKKKAERCVHVSFLP